MANALNGFSSAPFAGLGTASYQVTAAGLYTMEFKSFPPYFPPGSAAQSVLPTQKVSTVGTVADVAGSLNSTFFTFYDAGSAHGYYVWYNINAAGVDPAPAGLTGIMVAGATAVTANALATATRLALNSAGIGVSATGATNNVIITNSGPGTAANAADGSAPTGFSFTATTAGSWGTPPVSGLSVAMKNNTTILSASSVPSPTQPIVNGAVRVDAAANDVLSFVLSSLSPADADLNAVKSILNIYLGA